MIDVPFLSFFTADTTVETAIRSSRLPTVDFIVFCLSENGESTVPTSVHFYVEPTPPRIVALLS
jgi:hypothetical protein